MYKSTLLANLDKVVKVVLASGILVMLEASFLFASFRILISLFVFSLYEMLLLKNFTRIEIFNIRLMKTDRSVIIIFVVKCFKFEA